MIPRYRCPRVRQGMTLRADGDWVKYADVEALVAEHQRLREALERPMLWCWTCEVPLYSIAESHDHPDCTRVSWPTKRVIEAVLASALPADTEPA